MALSRTITKVEELVRHRTPNWFSPAAWLLLTQKNGSALVVRFSDRTLQDTHGTSNGADTMQVQPHDGPSKQRDARGCTQA